ncbi:hypothetical protein F5141DRAFT_763453 [Pisolithus sp. B1]|nr:hypothetical protein F5141DRAFT_763453 [Pisolithus sp. B1]
MPSGERVTAFVRKPPAALLSYLCTGKAGVTRMRGLMNLNKKQWTSLREGIKPLVLKYLDVEKPLAHQSEADLLGLKKKSLEKITFFNKYEDNWAFDVLLRFLFTHRYALAQAKQWSPSPLSDTEEPSQVRATRPSAVPSAGMLHQFLRSIKASHFLFCFMRAGLSDDLSFTEFIASPFTVKKSFVEAALQGTASDDEIRAVLAAVLRY